MGSAERQAAWRKRMQERGFKPTTEWVPPEHLTVYREIAAILRDGGAVEEKTAAVGFIRDGGRSYERFTGREVVITEAEIARFREEQHKKAREEREAREHKAAENRRAKAAKIEDEHRRAEMAYKASPWELEAFPVQIRPWSDEDQTSAEVAEAMHAEPPLMATVEYEMYRVERTGYTREILGARLIKVVKKTHKTARVAMHVRPRDNGVPQIGKEYYTAKPPFSIDPSGDFWTDGIFTIFRNKDLEAAVLYALANQESAFEKWMERKKSSAHFDVLGLKPGASRAEIKAAYRRAASEHHPDRGGDEARFKEIRAAYEALS